MNAHKKGASGLARGLPGLAQDLPALAGRADQEITEILADAQLARLGARFPGWRITRTASGFRARHRVTGAYLHGRTPAELENRLIKRRKRQDSRHRNHRPAR